MALPDYQGYSIVNLMGSLVDGLGGEAPSGYPLCPELNPDAVGHASNVVLLMLDGLGYEYLQQFPDSSLYRHLQARLTSVCPTTTAAAVTTLTTGLAPQQHGITGWFMYLRELGMVTTVLPFQSRAGQMPLAVHMPEALDLVRQTSVFARIPAEGWYLVPEFIVDSSYSQVTTEGANRRGFKGVSAYFDGIRDLLQQPAKRQRYVYAYWPGFDGLCHDAGVASSKVADHFRTLDRGFEALCTDLAGTDTLVVAIADHGLVDVTQSVWLDHHPELAAMLRVPLTGEPRLAYCYLKPGAEGEFLAYMREVLGDVCTPYPAQEAREAGWFGLGSPHPELDERIGDYIVVMHDGVIMKDRLIGEGDFRQVGTHGGLSDPEMGIPLVIRHC